MLALRMVAVKNSMKRLAALSPASAMMAGRIGPELVPVMLPALGVVTSSLGIGLSPLLLQRCLLPADGIAFPSD